MDGLRFDRIAGRLAQCQLSRRAALRVGSLGLTVAVLRGVGLTTRSASAGDTMATAGGTPAAKSTPFACPAATANEVNVDGAWLCNQLYALCTTAPCELSPSDPTIATCRCVVLDGYSIGFTSCRERIPVGAKLVSTFSTQNVNSAFGIMTCPESAPWANCLDMPCQLDLLNPAQATCQCPIVETGPSVTFGGDCDRTTCSSVIWSAATPPGVTQYATAMQCVNQTVAYPSVCPDATPATS